MARVTQTEVEAVIPGTSLTDLTPFIDSANLIVNKLSTTSCGDGLSEDELTKIELWLSAHYAAVADPDVAKKSERFEQYSVSFSRGGDGGSGVMSTQYGQMANTLSGGCLAEMDKTPVSMYSIGSC